MSTTAVLLAIGIYVLATTGVALWARRGSGQTLEDYFLANRTLGGIVSALSYSATTYSAFMMVGLAGLTYRGGIGALGFELIYLSGLLLVAFFGPRFWLAGRRYGIISPAELLSVRYADPRVGWVAAVLSLVFLVPYSAVQLMGVGYLLQGLSQGAIPFLAGVLLATVVAIVWAWLGGLRSVAWTDAAQALLMLATSILVVVFALSHLGGVRQAVERLTVEIPDWLAVPGGGNYFRFNTFLGLSLPWFFFSLSNPQVAQRLFVPCSLSALRRMLLGFIAFGLIYTLVSVSWGLASRLLLPNLANPDLATPTLLASQAVPDIVALLAMVGITAAAISTIDSILLTLASLVARDVLPLAESRHKHGNPLAWSRGVILLLGVVAFLFARLQLNWIALLSVASSAGLLALVPANVGVFFWKKGTAPGALASLIGGGLVSLVLQATGWKPLGWWPGVWTLLVATGLFIAVSEVTSAPTERATQFVDEIAAALRPYLPDSGHIRPSFRLTPPATTMGSPPSAASAPGSPEASR